MILTIAFRNILRNGRRSITTLSTIAVGAVAMLLFGAFMMASVLGVRTNAIQESGHLSIFQKGYFEFGAGNPSAYGIADYDALGTRISADPVLKPLIRVITPTVSVFGIAGNPDRDASKTFIGVGIVPADRLRLRTYDEYGVNSVNGRHPSTDGLRDDDPSIGYVGIGMARILGLCEALRQSDCPPGFAEKTRATSNVDGLSTQDFSALAGDIPRPATADGTPKLDLLGATANGAPNVVGFRVAKAVQIGTKALDDMFIGMNLTLAQQLLYGRHDPKVTALIVQLHHEADLAKVRERLITLFRDANLDLEVRDYAELTPMYGQIMGFFGALFGFIAVVMGIIVLFTVVNTMSMSVMERTNEIGTTRALGVRRSGIHRQFLVEGWLLGLLGATFGVVASYVLAWVFNHSGITWTPPGFSERYPIYLPMGSIPTLVVLVWLVLVIVAIVAALIPANRAARLPVIDALRHV